MAGKYPPTSPHHRTFTLTDLIFRSLSDEPRFSASPAHIDAAAPSSMKTGSPPLATALTSKRTSVNSTTRHFFFSTSFHYSLLTSQIKIRVGEYDFSSIQEPYPFAERGVARKVVHPKYNFFTYEYDLAMVRLDAPLEYAPHIVPICLPGSDDLLIGENATVTGWGRLSEGGTLPSVLQEVHEKNSIIEIVRFIRQ